MIGALTLSQAVADHLRSLIHRGEVAPGERLPAERELAKQLGVARISLREALKTLRDEGYVEVRRGAHGGTFVTELQRPVEAWRARMQAQAGEIDDIIDFRTALETDAARLAAARRTDADLETMEAAIQAMEGVDSRAAFRRSDTEFHAALARASRSIRLQNAIHAARTELFTPHDLLPYREPVQETVRDHRAILDAVRDAAPATAEAVMREHLERTRGQLRAIVLGVDADPLMQARAARPGRSL